MSIPLIMDHSKLRIMIVCLECGGKQYDWDDLIFEPCKFCGFYYARYADEKD